jgi:hypothetical protein
MIIFYDNIIKNIMILLLKLVITAITLFLFITLYLPDFDDRRNSLMYKLYLFLFMFLLQSTIGIFNNFFADKKISFNTVIENAVNNSLITVISYDIYNDMVYNGFYRGTDANQKTAVLVILIMGFITSIKLLEMLLTS